MIRETERLELAKLVQNFKTITRDQIMEIIYAEQMERIQNDENQKRAFRGSLDKALNMMQSNQTVKLIGEYVCQPSSNIDLRYVNALQVALEICDCHSILYAPEPFQVSCLVDNQFFRIASIEGSNAASVPMILSYIKADESSYGQSKNVYQYILVADSYETAVEIQEYDLPDTFQIAVVQKEEDGRLKVDFL